MFLQGLHADSELALESPPMVSWQGLVLFFKPFPPPHGWTNHLKEWIQGLCPVWTCFSRFPPALGCFHPHTEDGMYFHSACLCSSMGFKCLVWGLNYSSIFLFLFLCCPSLWTLKKQVHPHVPISIPAMHDLSYFLISNLNIISLWPWQRWHFLIISAQGNIFFPCHPIHHSQNFHVQDCFPRLCGMVVCVWVCVSLYLCLCVYVYVLVHICVCMLYGCIPGCMHLSVCCSSLLCICVFCVFVCVVCVIYICACMWCMHICISVCVCMHLCLYICVCVCVHLCICAVLCNALLWVLFYVCVCYICASVFVCMSLSLCVCICVCVCIFVRVCCVCVWVSLCVWLCVHISMYVWNKEHVSLVQVYILCTWNTVHEVLKESVNHLSLKSEQLDRQGLGQLKIICNLKKRVKWNLMWL